VVRRSELEAGEGGRNRVPSAEALAGTQRLRGRHQSGGKRHGVAEAPSIICQQELRRGSLIVPLPAWQFEEVDLSAYYLTRRHRSRVVELFLDHCVANAARILESGTTAVSRPQAKPSVAIPVSASKKRRASVARARSQRR